VGDVPGGTYARSFDGVAYTDQGFPATVTGFRLDKYEVTVGRFRKFVAAWSAGWRPAPGSGKHSHLSAGAGLRNSAAAGYEAGWVEAWNDNMAATVETWNLNLSCNVTFQNWTESAGPNENRPMNCLTWFDAHAFCIWDGGFLPSEAEWNFAASGGSEQRVHPWSSPPSSTAIDCSYAIYLGAAGGNVCASTGTADVGSLLPRGVGAFGHADLAGNVWEWNLDWYSPGYLNPCIDCSFVPGDATGRVLRGGSFFNEAPYLDSAYRFSFSPSVRGFDFGARCARSP
jgi:formylglycine-generating enzyme required for sulfatase activity